MDVIISSAASCATRRIAATAVFILVLALVVALCSFGQQANTISSFRDPVELVRKTVQNEIQAGKNAAPAHFMFRGTKTTSKESTTRLYVESKDATAGMVIAYNGKPLTPEQREAEEARVGRFISQPEELKRKREKDHEETERTLRIMRALPDAFLFEYEGQEPAQPGLGAPGGTMIKLKFRPNPNYQPPSRVEEVLTGMKGFLLIDGEHLRLAAIDGTLFKEVGFGWGILGHLNTGSRFIVQQQDAGDNVWEVSSMTLKFTGKIMLFKNLSIDSTEVFSDFKPVPSNMSFAQALELLKQEVPKEALKKEKGTVNAENCCQPPRTEK